MKQNEYLDNNEFDPGYNGFWRHQVKGGDSPSMGYDHWVCSTFDDSGACRIKWGNQPPTYF